VREGRVVDCDAIDEAAQRAPLRSQGELFMRNLPIRKYVPSLFIAGSAVIVGVSSGGCSAVNDAVSNVEQASSGCNEFNGGESSIASLSVDGDTKAFLTASANLVAIVTSAETDVLNACKAIDSDLKVTDTWSAMAPDGGAAPDAELTEACKQAASKITAILHADGGAGCQLDTFGGHCTVDAEAQATCESSCTGMTTCMPGDITTLCTPSEVTGECSGNCNASATCEGTVMAEAKCEGACEGDCTGMCDSKPCSGTRCTGMCEGTCNSDCKLAASEMVNCGANVDCRGGCSVAYTAPKCETTVTPPSCKVSETCQASCKSNVEAKTVCTPPGVALECGASVSSDVQAVINTVQKNLPPIILWAQTEEKIVVDAANQVVSTGKVVAENVTSLGGKAVACAATAATACGNASQSVNVSFMASVSVSQSCGAMTGS
jgi:hypothetical protein